MKDGDKVLFVEKNDPMKNDALAALKIAQNTFRGEADRLGLQSEQDVVDMVKEVRRTSGGTRHEPDN